MTPKSKSSSPYIIRVFKNAPFLAVLPLYLVALMLPAFYIVFNPDYPDQSLYSSGLDVLRTGFLGFYVNQYAWYANLLLFINIFIFIFGHYKTSIVFGVLAFIVSLDSFTFHSFPRDEGGNFLYFVEKLGAGFYFWEASILLFLAISIWKYREVRMARK